jgi:hypothetical protein
MPESKSRCHYRKLSVLKPCNGWPSKIVVLTALIAYNYFKLTDFCDFHDFRISSADIFGLLLLYQRFQNFSINIFDKQKNEDSIGKCTDNNLF